MSRPPAGGSARGWYFPATKITLRSTATSGERMTAVESNPSREGQKDPGPRRPYQAPRLVSYGPIHRLTHATGAANGDGGQSMMA